ncbi:hypothetical protein [Tenacibaculum discolor]
MKKFLLAAIFLASGTAFAQFANPLPTPKANCLGCSVSQVGTFLWK